MATYIEQSLKGVEPMAAYSMAIVKRFFIHY
jgi:hypothetical protein